MQRSPYPSCLTSKSTRTTTPATEISKIITKSVSRFARNTVDTLTAIRRLKEHGVEVYFEEQNIYTLDGKGELLLAIREASHQTSLVIL